MTDIEGRATAPSNPYADNPNVLPAHHPLTILKRLTYMGVSLYGLQHFNAFKVVFQSPHVRHEWFKIGLASTVGASS